MKTVITPLIALQQLRDDQEVTSLQIADLDLSKLPPRVRLRIKRPDGIVEIQRIGKKIHVRLHADLCTQSREALQNRESVYWLWEQAFILARDHLDESRRKDPLYVRSLFAVEINLPMSSTGSAAIIALDNAIEALITETQEILRMAAQGFKLIYPVDEDLD